jgi:hypothetical protein
MNLRTLLFSATALTLALALPVQADVVVKDNLSGTGDNVVFNSLSGDLATALLNGQHTGTVEFRDLTGSTTFTAAANGNDIKIEGSQNLFIQVFDTNHDLVGTTTQVFSVTGTGDLFAFVQANDANGNPEAIQAFDLTALFGALKPGQNGFTFNAINGEVMTSLRLLDVGGTITDFEHYRIDVAPLAAVPIPAPILLFASGLFGLGILKRYSARKRVGLDVATA